MIAVSFAVFFDFITALMLYNEISEEELEYWVTLFLTLEGFIEAICGRMLMDTTQGQASNTMFGIVMLALGFDKMFDNGYSLFQIDEKKG